MGELRHEPSAVLAANILEVARSIEQVALTSKNLKGTYVRRLKDDAGKARASVTELVKRTKASGSLVALERENIELRAKLHQARLEIDALKIKGLRTGKEGAGRGQQVAVSPKKPASQRERLCPAPAKQTGPVMTTRSMDRPGWKEEEQIRKVREEIQSLSEQVAAIRNIVVESVREEIVRKEERESSSVQIRCRGSSGAGWQG